MSDLAKQLSDEVAGWMQHYPRLSGWRGQLDQQFSRALDSGQHGDLPGWLESLESLPAAPALREVELTNGVSVSAPGPLPEASSAQLEQALRGVMPWRKGPYDLYGCHLDTEWRSDWKWERILPHLPSLAGRNILDVGCVNGYHLWSMLGAGANCALGIDPTVRFLIQFRMIRQLLGGDRSAFLVPITLESIPDEPRFFDLVFSMGVLYHRRSPLDHLLQLRACLHPGGTLVLETLVIEGREREALLPSDRYAKMPNVWFIPAVATLQQWVERCGFRNARCVDCSVTSTGEQRSTSWMTFESLSDFLDPHNPDLTVEGYPAPRRAVLIAEA